MPAPLSEPQQRQPSVLDQVPANEQASFQTALHEARYGVCALAGPERQTRPELRGWSHHASNPAQDLMFGFLENGGVRLLSGQPGKTWQGTLRLRASETFSGWKAEGTRAYRETDGLTEWYVNRTNGMEHGFTLKERPAGTAEGEPAVLRMNLEELRVSADPDRKGDLVLTDPATGQAVLGYRNLKVWDADGKQLAAEMRPSGDGFLIAVDDTLARYPVTIDPLIVSLEQSIQEGFGEPMAYIKASNTGASDRFGLAVAISGDTLVVGAPGEDSSAQGINGDQSGNAGSNSGAAYVFVRNAGTWVQQAYLKASNTGQNDGFGSAVAISGDTILVGAPNEASAATGINGNQTDNSAPGAGAAYVFARDGTTWAQVAYLKASNPGAGDAFGMSVGLSDGSIIVGADGEDSSATGVNGNGSNNAAVDSGAAYVFVRSGTTWMYQAYLKASNTGAGDRFGCSVGISGPNAVVGAWGEDGDAQGTSSNPNDNSNPDTGAAYAFRYSGTWTQLAYLKDAHPRAPSQIWGEDEPEWFGKSVAISGDTLAIGAPNKFHNILTSLAGAAIGAVYVYVRNGSNWTEQAFLSSLSPQINGALNAPVALSDHLLATGHVNASMTSDAHSRSVFVFYRSGTSWSLQTVLQDQTEFQMDCAVAVSGSTVVTGNSWESSASTGINGNPNDTSAYGAGAVTTRRLESGTAEDHFGLSVDVDGETAIVGALDHDYVLVPNAGKAWIFRRTGTTWNVEAGLTNLEPQAHDRFGVAVAVSGNRAVVGADYDDERNTLGNLKVDCGSATVFGRDANGVWTRQVKLSADAASGDSFGRSVAIDASTTVVGAPGASSGNGKVMTYANGGWFAQALSPTSAQAGALFGFSVAVSGQRIIVGAPRTDVSSGAVVDAGKIYYFKTGIFGLWEADGSNGPILANACAGFSVALDGDVAVVGCSGPAGWAGGTSDSGRTGRAFVVTHNGTSWNSSFQYLDATGLPAGAWFGMSVAVENSIIAVGAFGNGVLTGKVRIFQREGTAWVKQPDLSVAGGESDNAYGVSVALSGDTLLVGGYGADSNWINAGMAWAYRITGGATGVPVLTLALSGSNALLTWPATPGWSLYRSPSLQSGSWLPVSVTTDGAHSYPISSAPRMFFRLQKP